MTDLITKLDDERLDSSGPYPSREVMYDSLCAAIQERDALKEWKDGANVMITALNNRIKEVENQFTEYAHDSEIKHDALLKRAEELEGTMQTALDLLVESMSDMPSYDFRARRDSFIHSELKRRSEKGGE